MISLRRWKDIYWDEFVGLERLRGSARLMQADSDARAALSDADARTWRERLEPLRELPGGPAFQDAFDALTAAVSDRRCGMLIRGAIIAREMGIPCVNGVARAVEQLRDGDVVTADGHLGIVTVGPPEFDPELA